MEIVLERSFDPPIGAGDVRAMAQLLDDCSRSYKFSWRESYLAADGGRMCCWFSGVDAESVRHVLRQNGVDTSALWPGTVHSAAPPHSELQPNVLVTRSFAKPVELEHIQAIEDAGDWCLQSYQTSFVRTLFSLDRKRMLCLYCAPDAESVRLAQRQAGMPVQGVWSFTTFRP
ncbi:MAG: DUF4242 domain-containing protein [Haliea sp.]